MWLPIKAEEGFTCPWNMVIPCWIPIHIFQGHRENFIIIIIIIITIIIFIIFIIIVTFILQ